MTRRGDEDDGPDLDDDERDVNNEIADFTDDHLHGFEVPVVSEHFLTCCLSEYLLEYLQIVRVFANCQSIC